MEEVSVANRFHHAEEDTAIEMIETYVPLVRMRHGECKAKKVALAQTLESIRIIVFSVNHHQTEDETWMPLEKQSRTFRYEITLSRLSTSRTQNSYYQCILECSHWKFSRPYKVRLPKAQRMRDFETRVAEIHSCTEEASVMSTPLLSHSQQWLQAR